MDWLSLGIIIGCAVMFVIAIVWSKYRARLKADEEARERALRTGKKGARKEKSL
ncbi:MAG: hypothetical protein LBT19_01695 [Candidatus Nomurabacteria bacterium]|jgi:hypothetical protein|nr:hypothetical protein [Candidatus Nomurabacteria bacterium]